jgi:hypothetical protein
VRRGIEVLFCLCLVAEHAMREVGDIEAGECIDRVSEQRGMTIRVIEIGNRCLNEACSARAKVTGHCRELLSVTGHQEEAGAL